MSDSPASPPGSPGETLPSGPAAATLASLCDFFLHLPPDTGMTYVIAAPFAPAVFLHRIAETLRRCAVIPVVPVIDPVPAAPDTIYILPPSCHFYILDGLLEPLELETGGGEGQGALTGADSSPDSPEGGSLGSPSIGIFISGPSRSRR